MNHLHLNCLDFSDMNVNCISACVYHVNVCILLPLYSSTSVFKEHEHMI